MGACLSGKVGLVTGGSSGIGRATAIAFARAGARIVVADVAMGGGEEVVRVIKEGNGDAIFVQCDVSEAAEVEAMVAKAVRTYGRLDCAFNNAGIEGEIAPLDDCTEENWDRVIKVNLKGVWLCMKYEIRHMLKQGGGSIVNMSSVSGLVGDPDHPAYGASKHGVSGLTKAAALGYASRGIRVNAVCPAAIRTPMIERTLQAQPDLSWQSLADGHPLGRIGEPEEVAEAVLWLCSDAASFTTGHLLVLDGGMIAQ
jgi:NAD(P)-dependent dehydrogenase (short-subunit alcohol dehydrogenase family)